ncbi:MAG TPA: hypothetical protein VK756_05385 [Solirubrobacteraceae bacterium]|nr:hypothetical protein [Solirubrobacteraceae bacterium]
MHRDRALEQLIAASAKGDAAAIVRMARARQRPLTPAEALIVTLGIRRDRAQYDTAAVRWVGMVAHTQKMTIPGARLLLQLFEVLIAEDQDRGVRSIGRFCHEHQLDDASAAIAEWARREYLRDW